MAEPCRLIRLKKLESELGRVNCDGSKKVVKTEPFCLKGRAGSWLRNDIYIFSF